MKQGQGDVDNLPDEEDPVYVEISNGVEIIDLTEDAEDGESGLEKQLFAVAAYKGGWSRIRTLS